MSWNPVERKTLICQHSHCLVGHSPLSHHSFSREYFIPTQCDTQEEKNAEREKRGALSAASDQVFELKVIDPTESKNDLTQALPSGVVSFQEHSYCKGRLVILLRSSCAEAGTKQFENRLVLVVLLDPFTANNDHAVLYAQMTNATRFHSCNLRKQGQLTIYYQHSRRAPNFDTCTDNCGGPQPSPMRTIISEMTIPSCPRRGGMLILPTVMWTVVPSRWMRARTTVEAVMQYSSRSAML